VTCGAEPALFEHYGRMVMAMHMTMHRSNFMCATFSAFRYTSAAVHCCTGCLTKQCPWSRLTAIVELLRKRLPGMHVVVAAVLPRGWAGPTDYSWPNAFTKVKFDLCCLIFCALSGMPPSAERCCKLLRCAVQSVDFVNEHMATAAASMANVTYVDCNGDFMARGKINSRLMPDALHPNPSGADTKTCWSEHCGASLIGDCSRGGLTTYLSLCSAVLIIYSQNAGLDVLAKCYKSVLSDLGLLKQTRRLRVRLKQ
jgi:hypothetical protein